MSTEDTNILFADQADAVKKTGAKVYKLTVEDKVAYLRSPNRMVMSLAMTEQAKGNLLAMSEVLLENCWICGHDEIKTDDAYFLGATSQIQNIVQIKSASLEKY